jgi:hypothetical protein
MLPRMAEKDVVWSLLTRADGTETHSPTVEDLTRAIHDLLQSPTASDLVFQVALASGHALVIELTRSGRLTFTHWADDQFQLEAEKPRTLPQVTPDRALEILVLTQDAELPELHFLLSGG